jgi:hypothetical protein
MSKDKQTFSPIPKFNIVSSPIPIPKEIIALRQNGKQLTDSCFGSVEVRVSLKEEKGEEKQEEWLSFGPMKAKGCSQHKPPRCSCSSSSCHENHIRCRCHDAERNVARRCIQAIKNKWIVKEMKVYSELFPCQQCRAYFKSRSMAWKASISMYWSAENSRELRNLLNKM